MRTVTAAQRWTTPEAPKGHGDMVWLSWKPGLRKGKHGPYTQEKNDKRNTHPGVGNYLWAISARGAKQLQHVKEVSPQLLPRPAWDVTLRHALMEPGGPLYWNGNEDGFGACFVCPPMGNTVGHQSGTSRNVYAKSEMDAKWCRPGTSHGKWWPPRHLCGFTEKKPASMGTFA